MSRKVVGVTGGFCTGKTVVADLFVEKGAYRIDADDIAHHLLSDDKDIQEQVVGLFGEGVLTEGTIDRKKVAKKVFSDKYKLEDFCRILHPRIISLIKGEIARHEDEVIVVDAPLLIEAGQQDLVDIVVVVTADYQTQIRRATNRGFSDEEARSIIANQMPLSEKEKFADFIIDNSSDDIKITKEGVEKVWQKM